MFCTQLQSEGLPPTSPPPCSKAFQLPSTPNNMQGVMWEEVSCLLPPPLSSSQATELQCPAEQVERPLLWFLLAQFPYWAFAKLLSTWPARYRRDGNEHRSPRKKMASLCSCKGISTISSPFPFVFLICHFNFCVPSRLNRNHHWCLTFWFVKV
uniref:Uncharacterized protein n=1 Tax=Micrurus surinamensis TaxID=129470 RepID=A0A2D4NXX4_MICSU